MTRFAVTAFGADRPGIVAEVTGALMTRGGNLADTAMTILGGHFAMMLMVEMPEGEEAPSLEQSLAEALAPQGLSVAVRPIADDASAAPGQGSAWAVSVYGADHPGIVHRVTRLLAAHGANIADLSTRVVGSGAPSYVMLLEVALPPGADAGALADELEAAAAELGVEVHLRPDDADVF